MQDFHLSVLTRTPLSDRGVARAVLRSIFEADASLAPSRYGSYEPLPYRVSSPLDLDALLEHWADPFLWNQGRRTQGSIWFGTPTMHDAIRLSTTSSKVPYAVLSGLLRDLSLQVSAEFARLYFQYEDREEYRRRYKAAYPMCLGPTTHDLRLSIPDLAWATLFGPPYTALIPSERLSSCPAFQSTEIAPGYWYIQLTSDPTAARKDPISYSSIRDAAKQHLGLDLFLDLARPGARRTAPAFPWAPEVRNPLLEYLRANNLLVE